MAPEKRPSPAPDSTGSSERKPPGWLRRFKRFMDQPVVDASLGLLLVAAVLVDSWETIWPDLTDLRFKVHHGIAVYGLATFLRAMPGLVESIYHLFEYLPAGVGDIKTLRRKRIDDARATDSAGPPSRSPDE